MSDLESKQRGIKFEPVAQSAPDAPGYLSFLVGVVWPAAVILLELATRMCAEAFFDPMPTLWHALAVAFVPASNLLLWLRLRRPPGTAAGSRRAADRWLA